MRSSGRAASAALLVTALTVAPQAQSSQPKALYTEAVAREAVLRKQLDALPSQAQPEPLLTRVRTLVSAYDDMSRLFPSSGYGDNALWQGASLAADAFWQFGTAAERATALRLYEALTARFPTSSLVKQVPAQIKRLAAATERTAPATVAPPAPSPLARTSPVASPPAPSQPALAAPAARTPVTPPPRSRTRSGTVALTAIRREALPDALRVTLELDREVPFHDERLDGPPRVFLDLQNTRAVAALQDAVIAVDDDLVQRIRVGRQLDFRTRVVLDLKNASRYSVYTLYNPYRVVIDFERPAAPAGTPEPLTPTVTAKTTPVSVAPAAPVGPVLPLADPAVPPAPPRANATGTFSLSRQLGLGVARIVIDAGHGGHDPGAKARGLTEAELVLDVALRLEKLLLNQPGVEVVLTRRTDTFVALEERTEIANREGADLFLSIHANASADAAARGIETYFLNFAPNPQAEAVAARENAGAAKNMRHLPEIVKAIALNNKIDESRDFAAAVQGALHDRLKKVNREVRSLGVKQAPFMVLIGATMPSVLAEISFITNRQDATLLKTEKYRQQIAEALLAGVMKYQQSLKRLPAMAGR
jgi:N-acetylmuramoyl-L-alanine amidase